MAYVFFFQAEDGIRDAQESRGLGDVYKRQGVGSSLRHTPLIAVLNLAACHCTAANFSSRCVGDCLLYTSDAADDLLCVDLGGRRIIKQTKSIQTKNAVTGMKTTIIERPEHLSIVGHDLSVKQNA